MAEVSAEARIEAPAEKVWAKLTDLSVYGEWSVTHTGFPKGTPTSLEPGSTFEESMRLMGFPAEVNWTVDELEEGHVFAFKGKGPMGVKISTRYSLAPEGEATMVRIDGSFTGSAAAMLGSKLKESATEALGESLRKLSALVV